VDNKTNPLDRRFVMETFLQEICDGVVKGEVRTVEAKVQEALQKGIKPWRR